MDDDLIARANVLVFEGQIGTEDAAAVEQNNVAIGGEALGKRDGD
jgi:hypothetical protein